ncbi:MAG: LysM peptidoglycan-binding domain-containing protein [Acidobacteriota bacterium]|nr:MAG: LysM peptidoglycan-binding domain-containing protein [Acidobacteriota bacterium]
MKQVYFSAKGSLAILLILGLHGIAYGQWGVSVKSDDRATVKEIAAKYGVNTNDLAAVNGLLPNSIVTRGRALRLPFEPCSVQSAPAIRGINLGADMNEIEKRFLKTRYPFVDGTEDLSVSNLGGEKIPGLDGIASLRLVSFEGNLYQVFVSYDFDVSWESIDEMVLQFNDSLGVPLTAWKVQSRREGDEATVECDGFTIKTRLVVGRGMLILTDVKTEHAIERRKKEAADAKKRAIKP